MVPSSWIQGPLPYEMVELELPHSPSAVVFAVSSSRSNSFGDNAALVRPTLTELETSSRNSTDCMAIVRNFQPIGPEVSCVVLLNAKIDRAHPI